MKISVARSCNEVWENMLPCTQGRYCLSCQKTVVDCTAWSDDQLAAFFRNKPGEICGRFTSGQLNRTLHTKVQLPYRPTAAAMLLAGTLSSTSLSATELIQDTPNISLPKLQTGSQIQLPSYPSGDTIRGRVVDEQGLPISGAMLALEETGQSAYTDSNGLFSLNVPEQQTNSIVQVMAIGYTMQRIAAPSLHKGCSITLQTNITPGGPDENIVLVVGGAFIRRNWWQRLWRWGKH